MVRVDKRVTSAFEGVSVRRRVFSCFCAVLVLAVSAAAQDPHAPEGTPDGRPDLQGYWYFGLATPLERPKEFANQVYLTPEQASSFEQRTADRRRDVVAVHGPEWLDYGSPGGAARRTSIVIDPPDGRVPALTPQARAMDAARRAAEQSGIADNPEERTPQERCLVFGAGPPLLPGPYNNNIEIVQTSDAVVVLSEMIHDARIVPVDGRPAPPASMRFWLGASRGRWDGDTLIVETTNFAGLVTFRGSDERL